MCSCQNYKKNVPVNAEIISKVDRERGGKAEELSGEESGFNTPRYIRGSGRLASCTRLVFSAAVLFQPTVAIQRLSGRVIRTMGGARGTVGTVGSCGTAFSVVLVSSRKERSQQALMRIHPQRRRCAIKDRSVYQNV
jgi:hypothetical protein